MSSSTQINEKNIEENAFERRAFEQVGHYALDSRFVL